MTLTMNGDHATVVVHGDFNDFGSGVQAVESKYVDVTPPPCSSRFTGQKKYLDQLQECFTPRSCDSQSNVPSGSQQGKNPGIECSEETRRCVLLHGIGGVGKTQVALKFAENASKRFWRTFWIDASSAETMELSFKSIAQDAEAKALGVDSSAPSVLRWLAREERDWLLIYDNADGRPEDIEAYMPQGPGGNILLTSRNPNMRQFVSSKEAIVHVVDMNEDDATSLLLKWVTHEDSAADVKPLARSIVQKLYCLPLAVDQAGATIHSGLCTIDEYLSMYWSRRKDLMSHPSFNGASNYGRAAFTTWDLSYNKLHAAALGQGDSSHMTSDAAKSAMLIIDTFPFFHNDSISEEILKRAAESSEKRPWSSDETPAIRHKKSLHKLIHHLLPSDKAGSSKHFARRNKKAPITGSDGVAANSNDNEFLQRLTHRLLGLDNTGKWDPFPFREGIQLLNSLSLISTDTSRRSYSFHPLVHSWSRDRMTEEDRKVRCRSASALLAHSIAWRFRSSDYAFRLNIIPHIKSCQLQATQVLKSNIYAEAEFTKFGLAYQENGFYKEAENLLVRVMEMRTEALGREHLDTLTSMADLSATYSKQGRYDEAEKLRSETLELRKKVLGTEHPDTLKSMNDLSKTYTRQGRHKEAEKLQLETLELRKKVIGREHSSTLTSMANLATTYSQQGRLEEAEELQAQYMESTKNRLGREHPHTLKAMGNLATIYSEQGRHQEAEKLEVEILELRKNVLGKEHPNTLAGMGNLAMTYSRQGRHKEAEKLGSETLELRKIILGREHPHTLTNMKNLAVTWKNLGRNTEAIELMIETTELYVKVWGPNHQDTRDCKRRLEKFLTLRIA